MIAARTRGQVLGAAAAAAQTTDRVEEMIRDALAALNADRRCNGFGVYTDRSSVRSNLETAKFAIEHALRLIGTPAVWPGDDNYDEVPL